MDAYLFPVYAAADPVDVADLLEPDRLITQGTYTPTLTATGGTPAIGASGAINGWYHRTGLLIDVWAHILLSGAGVSIVGTSWRVSLPFSADTSLHTAGALDAVSTAIGTNRTRSGTATQSQTCAALLSAASEMIFYGPATNTSLGSADFTTTARMHIRARYIAAASNF